MRSVESWSTGAKNHLLKSFLRLDDSSFGRDIAKVKAGFRTPLVASEEGSCSSARCKKVLFELSTRPSVRIHGIRKMHQHLCGHKPAEQQQKTCI